MTARIRITLEPKLHRMARERAAELGISLAEYVRQLVARDLASPRMNSDPSCIFDLGSSGGSDIAKHKHAMLSEAFRSGRLASPRG